MKNHKKTPDNLKIAHYNILKGGYRRISKIARVIEEMDADIVGLIEASLWHKDTEKFKRYANKLGYAHFYVAKANTQYDIAVLSKIELKTESISKGFRHVLLNTVIKKGAFADLNISFVHLSPISEKDRLAEIDLILKRSGPDSLLMGDFNSLSPTDPYHRSALLSFFHNHDIKKYGHEKLSFELIKKLESKGFIDVMKALKKPFAHSVPTPFNKDLTHAKKLRIDYAFLNKKVLSTVTNARFFKTKEADAASDHYPLLIELNKKV